MRNYLQLRKYSLAIIAIYVLLLPILAVFLKGKDLYRVEPDTLALPLMIFFFSLLLFFGALRIRHKKPAVSINRVGWAAFYGAVIAFPEEIIFRGIVQGFFQAYVGGTIFSVLLSSLVFGVAHLPNGAKGFRPKHWNWGLAGLTFLGGLVLGWLFAATDSLLLPTLLHIAFAAGLYLFTEKISAKGQA